MACERCIDIHKAQSAGATQNKCRCECHNKKDENLVPNTTWLNMTTAGAGIDTGATTGSFGSVTLNSDGTFT